MMAELAVNPIIVKGKFNEALVYAKAVEAPCENKIRQYLDHPAFSDTIVRIMPDVQLGKSTVIGCWTATYNTLLIPSVIGLELAAGFAPVILAGESCALINLICLSAKTYLPDRRCVLRSMTRWKK
ncbi:MAG: hypothetical protein LBH43_18285 [Treponema sp.]|nr:hypothetical protein [Treponema sp.]